MANAKGARTGDGPVIIKKYANRRLYNTASSADITRSVLAPIIFDEEGRSESLLPIQFLRQLIGFYGNSMQAFLPSYLEMSLASFADQQERLRQQMTGATPAAGLAVYEEQVKKNMVLFNQAMQMFSPFAYGKPEAQAAPAAETPPTAPPASEDAIADLKRRMEEMAAQIDRLASGR